MASKNFFGPGECQNCGRPSGDKTRCPRCMEYVTTSNRRRRERLRAEGKCPRCGEPCESGYCHACYIKARDKLQRLRVEVVRAYGGVCECCGEHHLEFLHIDHVNGNGNEERASAKARGLPQTIYARLKKQGFPAGYRVLCANCNMALAFYGYCPHHPEVVRSPAGCERQPTGMLLPFTTPFPAAKGE